MAYVYDGPGYRGGGTGVESDFGMRDFFAQEAARSLGQGLGMPTAEQIERARGDLGGAATGWQNLMNNGMYSGAEQQGILSARVQEVNNATRAMQQNMNAQMAQRGLGGNAGAQAALGMAGQFQAAGQRGMAYGDIQKQQAESRMRGLEGYTGVQGALSGLAATATRQDPNTDAYGSLYEKWRNKKVGYDGANWGKTPTAPAHY